MVLQARGGSPCSSPGGHGPGGRHDKSSTLARWRRRGQKNTGAVEEAGDVALVGHNIEDPHAAAALAADGDVDGEDAGEETGPADAARSGGGLGGGQRARLDRHATSGALTDACGS